MRSSFLYTAKTNKITKLILFKINLQSDGLSTVNTAIIQIKLKTEKYTNKQQILSFLIWIIRSRHSTAAIIISVGNLHFFPSSSVGICQNHHQLATRSHNNNKHKSAQQRAEIMATRASLAAFGKASSQSTRFHFFHRREQLLVQIVDEQYTNRVHNRIITASLVNALKTPNRPGKQRKATFGQPH